MEATLNSDRARESNIPVSSPLPMARYSNRAIAPSERFSHWRAAIGDVYDASPVASPSADGVVETCQWSLGGALIVAGHYTAVRVHRTERSAHTDQFDHYMLRLCQSSHMRVEVDGVCIDVSPCQPILLDMARPFVSQADSGICITVYLRRTALDALLPRALDLHGVRLSGAAGAVLAEHLFTLARLLPNMPAEAAPGACKALEHLLAASLAPSMESLGLARTAADQNLGCTARSFIEAHLTDADLSIELLCRHFKVSRSSIYRVFEPLGGVAGYIRSRRLARVHSLLSSSSRRHHIGRLAEDYGFRSQSHFSRAFLAQFGCRPGDVMRTRGLSAGRQSVCRMEQDGDFRPWLEAVRDA